jgi:nucleoside-diphosphate-sugar epimerase
MSTPGNNLVLLTGATGLVGGHMLVRLFKSGKNVRCLIRSSSSLEQLKLICTFYNQPFEDLNNAVEWVQGDTLDFIGLCSIMKQVTEVYHCAAMVSFRSKNRVELFQTNVQGTSNMVDAALMEGVGKFCFVSSIAALGSTPDQTPVMEDTPRKNEEKTSAYSESKFRTELEVWRAISEGLNAVIVNPGVILGPGNPDAGSLLLFQVGRKGMPFFTRATTGYVDVRDVCDISIELMERGLFQKRYVLISENAHNGTVFGLIGKEFGKNAPRIQAGKALLCIGVLFSAIAGRFTGKPSQLTLDTIKSAQNPQVYSNERIHKTLDYSFIPLQQTIRETSDFLKKTDSKKQKKG